jgi:hypothetical protein
MPGKGMKGAKNLDRSASFSPAVCAPFTIDPAGTSTLKNWIHVTFFIGVI